MGNNVVLSDGTVAALFGELADRDVGSPRDGRVNAKIYVATSTDGGDRISPVATVDQWWMDRGVLGAHIPSLAADPGSKPFKDRLYAVWSDRRNGHMDILLAWSSDKGKTWSKPVVVNHDPNPGESGKGPDHLLPAVGVNKDGVVLVTWQDRRESGDNLGWRLRAAASLDGGETFSASVPVGSAANAYPGSTAWDVAVSANTSQSLVSLNARIYG